MTTVAERLRQVTLKVERAKKHIADLDQCTRVFLDAHPYKVATKRDPQSRKLIYYVMSAERTPDYLALVSGDAVQNLMSALDHLAYQLVCHDTHDAPPNPNWIYFPIADDAPKYEARKGGKVEGAHPDTLKAIDALKPYKGGNDALWQLYRLNSIEKHRLLLTVGANFRSFDVGAHAIGEMRKAFPDLGDIPDIPLFIKPADAMFPLKAGDELFIDGPDAEVNQKMQFRFDVALNEPGIIDGKPLLETLHQFTTLVEGIVTALTSRLS